MPKAKKEARFGKPGVRVRKASGDVAKLKEPHIAKKRARLLVGQGQRARELDPHHERRTEKLVVTGYFDLATGLSTVTDGPMYGINAAAPANPQAETGFDVVVVENHIFQVKPSALKHLRNFTEDEIHALVIPKRTLARRVADRAPLTVEETDKVVRLARTDKLAGSVFGDAAKAHRWLRKPKGSLGGETPLAYLATEAGARVVEEMLNQIDHGLLP